MIDSFEKIATDAINVLKSLGLDKQQYIVNTNVKLYAEILTTRLNLIKEEEE